MERFIPLQTVVDNSTKYDFTVKKSKLTYLTKEKLVSSKGIF